MVLEIMAELRKKIILNASLSSRGLSLVRKTFPIFAFALLMLSLGASLFSGRPDDVQNIAIIMADGTPPEFILPPPPTTYVDKGVAATFNIIVSDVDDNPVHVEWSWGDGSANDTNDTPPASTPQPVSQMHTWDPFVEQGSGDFYILFELNVTIDDGHGNFVTISRSVQVYVPTNAPPTVAILGPSTPVDPLDNVTIYANASDPEGEPLTWTFVFNDTKSDFLTYVNYSGATAPNELVWMNISHVFEVEGQYNVTVYVSDALPPNQTFPHNVSVVTTVLAVWNAAPITSSEVAADPPAPVINQVTKSVFVNYSVQASDSDGDVITATWDFGDGGSGAVNVSDGGPAVFTFVQMKKYTTGGTFNVSVVITDGRVNHTVTLYRIITVNSPPKFNQSVPPTIYANNNKPLTINITVYDANNDPVHVEWSWGDGSANDTNDTPPAFTAQPVSQTHTWHVEVEQGTGDFYVPVGRLNVTLTDPNGSYVTVSRPVQVLIPENDPPNIDMGVQSKVFDPADNVTFIANASDPEGESLTWTFVFNDSMTDFLTIVNHTGPTAPYTLLWNNVSHVFGAEGVFKVTMYVSDALGANQTGLHNLSLSYTVRVMWNVAPSASLEVAADPIEPVINSSIGYVLVSYSVEAYDNDGDILTGTWNFGDGGPGAVNVSEGGAAVKYKFVQIINYTDTGVHNISVVISDGYSNHTLILYRNVTVTSTNLPPNVVGVNFTYPSGNFALLNETLTFTFVFTDPERDPIQVIVDFGDGFIGYYNVTQYGADGNASLTFTHAFSETGTKKVVVLYTDNKLGYYEHNLYQNLSLEVSMPVIIPPNPWSWWDYTSLAMVFMIPVLVAIRFFMVNARRKRLEEEGLSIEEWKLMKKVELDQDVKESKSK